MTRAQKNWLWGGGFTLLTSLFFLLTWGQLLPAPLALAMTAVYGAGTAFLVWTGVAYRERLQRRAFAGKKQAIGNTDSEQARTIEVDLPFEAAYDAALAAIQQLDRQRIPMPDDPLVRLEMLVPRKQALRLYKTDREMGDIDAGLRARFLGIPDLIDFSRLTLRLQRVDATTTRLRIESKPANIMQVYDLGKNLHYVNHIARTIRRAADAQEAATARLSDSGYEAGLDADGEVARRVRES